MATRIEDVTDADRAIGQAIREAREARGITRTELGARVGLSQPAVSLWELGQRTPNLKDIPRIAGALGLSAVGLARKIFSAIADKTG